MTCDIIHDVLDVGLVIKLGAFLFIVGKKQTKKHPKKLSPS